MPTALIMHLNFDALALTENQYPPSEKYSIGKKKIYNTLPILKTSAKSVQTTAEVCADYG